MNITSECVTLFQLMDSVVNVDHAVTVVGKWTFGYISEKSLPLNSDSLHLIFDCSDK